jgi:hypothetical protein
MFLGLVFIGIVCSISGIWIGGSEAILDRRAGYIGWYMLCVAVSVGYLLVWCLVELILLARFISAIE